MTKRIPSDVFAFYYSLGAERSYQRVADEYGVTKQAVAKVAAREKWAERVERIDGDAQEKVDRQLAETVEEMQVRHLKMVKVVQGKALEVLKTTSLSTAMEAVRALEMTIKQERLIRGEPTDRSAVSVEETIRREYDRWMVQDGDQGDDDG